MREAVRFICAILIVLGFSPAIGRAQSIVTGSGVNVYLHGAPDGGNLFRQVSVHAWLDRDGIARGTMTWEGNIFQPLPGGQTGFRGGPADPFLIEVTDLFFFGNTVDVIGVVVNSPNHEDEGAVVLFTFTDNNGTNEPDQIDNEQIVAGTIIVR